MSVKFSYSGLNLRGSHFQSHFKQRTLFDHFLVIRQPTPAPTLAKPDGPSHDESQIDVEHTGTECSPGASQLPELPSVEQPDDKAHVASSPLGSSQSTADVDISAPGMHWPFLTLT